MIINVTRKFIKGSSLGKVTTNIYNLDGWEEAIKWADGLNSGTDNTFKIIEIKNEYGQKKIYE